ncbi:hypothetical protein K466DRAFT_660391 [Polyporus arcularius HHB13444]|uniref:Uncharacterized protein n=1 Tax=Polyporus arcularius HHB13444 TaxID=1314778 RepID=A0A5C3PRI1_9APHY|nr:hypothetical protein K466DRAFT_660391 [Polyporus arcularius HHB13444]
MSNNANTATASTASTTTPAKSSTPTSTAKGADDTKSIASETATLYDVKDNKADSKETKEGDTLGASSTAFSKKAKEQGWAAPTATRPSFG